MDEELLVTLNRQPTLQTITWLLTLKKFEQLDLNPPYQRKSVWTTKEKRRFLDTVFKNYPSPPIFLHRSIDDEGNAMYHVVDGKQRLSSVFEFAEGKVRLPDDFGDSRLDGKNWKDLSDFSAAKQKFWSYQFTVEFIDDIHEPLVREIFSRLNQNSRKLERQELRHARFDGWLITYLEKSAEDDAWKTLRIATPARSRRMSDVQILLEFAQVTITRQPSGFDQDELDELCATYDDLDQLNDFDSLSFSADYEESLARLKALENHNNIVSSVAGQRNNLYSLWCYVALDKLDKKSADIVADRAKVFFDEAKKLRELEQADPQRDRSDDDPNVSKFVQNSTGAATEKPQRQARYEALKSFLSEST